MCLFEKVSKKLSVALRFFGRYGEDLLEEGLTGKRAREFDGELICLHVRF